MLKRPEVDGLVAGNGIDEGVNIRWIKGIGMRRRGFNIVGLARRNNWLDALAVTIIHPVLLPALPVVIHPEDPLLWCLLPIPIVDLGHHRVAILTEGDI